MAVDDTHIEGHYILGFHDIVGSGQGPLRDTASDCGPRLHSKLTLKLFIGPAVKRAMYCCLFTGGKPMLVGLT